MLKTQAFAALRPRPDLSARVASVPYDVVNRKEAQALADAEPLSFLHVVRSEVDLPATQGAYDDAVYERARQNFDALIERGVLIREAEPRMYLYRQKTKLLGRDVEQVGVVCTCHVDDYESGVIKRHENTRRDKEDDRTRHVLSLGANTGPVFMMVRDEPALAELISQGTQGEPLYDFEAVDGVRHTVFSLPDAEPFKGVFAGLPCAYIADGHHRSASAARAAKTLRQGNPFHEGHEEYNWFLSVIFMAKDLTILPYHRTVRDLGRRSPSEFLSALGKIGELSRSAAPEPRNPGSFGVFVDGAWYTLNLRADSIAHDDPVRSLDYSVLSERVLAPLLDIADLRTDHRIDFVGGIRGSAELERRVKTGEAAAAFFMRPVSIQQLMAVADAGAIMPPKSTWFEPKLRSGLLIHTL